MSEPWEQYSTVIPASPDIPYQDPRQRYKEEVAQEEYANAQILEDWKTENLKRMYNPVEAGVIGAANEIAQVGGGAVDLARSFASPKTESDLSQYLSQQNKNVDALREARPVSTTLGAMTPYIATGAGADAMYLKAVSRMKNSPVAYNALTGPGFRGAIPGAAEGAAIGTVDPRYDPLQGALGGGSGGAVGGIVASGLSKRPNFLTSAQKDVVKQGEDWGMNFLPGAKSGIPSQMEKDYALMRNAKTQGPIHLIDQRNKEILTDKTTDVMGLSHAGNVDATILSAHESALGRQFDEFIEGTEVALTDRMRSRWDAAMGQYNKETGKKASGVLNQFRKELNIKGNRLPPHVFKRVNENLSRAINDRAGINATPSQKAEQRALIRFKNTLYDSLLDSQKAGSAKKKQLKELNDKWAATTFAIENQIFSPDGYVDPGRLARAMQGKKNVRQYTLGQGPWKQWGDVARIGQHIERSRTPSLSAPQTLSKVTGTQNFRNLADWALSEGSKLNYIGSPAFWAYRKGYPLNTGLLGLPAETVTKSGIAGSAWGIQNQGDRE